MVTLLAAMLIFLDMIIYIIFFDVILSWLQLFGIRFRPRFIAAIIDPLYGFVKSVIPTTIGPIELVPIVVLFVIIFLQ
ncbi:MAG: YggT family protein [Candidatus Peribacteria bacterium]|nr:MAG: YggT family protein [Candidatus Peribacteria bacterium]